MGTPGNSENTTGWGGDQGLPGAEWQLWAENHREVQSKCRWKLNDLKRSGALDIYLFCTDGPWWKLSRQCTPRAVCNAASSTRSAPPPVSSAVRTLSRQYPSCVKSWEDNWEVLSTFKRQNRSLHVSYIPQNSLQAIFCPIGLDLYNANSLLMIFSKKSANKDATNVHSSNSGSVPCTIDPSFMEIA